MSFQRARTEEQFAHRQTEIINACIAIFDNMGFDDVTIKSIAEKTSFTRPSIYNYYKTKEEVFLDILKQEYLNWNDDMKERFDSADTMTKEEFCRFITGSLAKRIKMLKLLSIHLTAIENNCSVEKLAEFKRDCSIVFETFCRSLDKFFPGANMESKHIFVSTFFPFLYGLYPTTHMTKKQVAAMELAGIQSNYVSFDELCYKGMLILASVL